MIIAEVEGIHDRITATLSSIPIKNEVCIVYNRKTNQTFVATPERNLDTLKVYFRVNDVQELDEAKKNEFFGPDYTYLGEIDFLK